MEIIERLESEVRSYCRSFPTVFTRAEGAHLFDDQGARYLDFFAGAGALNYGHNHPLMVERLVEYVTGSGVAHSLDMATRAKVDFMTAFGMIGLETALPLVLELWREGVIELGRAVALMTARPARLFGLDRGGAGSLAPGAPADLAVLDLDHAWTVEPGALHSRSHNTPFGGRAMRGAALLTLLGGRPTFDRAGLVSE